ncbi:FeoB-associated Cys-rich membrane protein [Clostridium botulinum]|uniref:FeoB-associated Cys-rich membrane protein n=1 Tax=Clostridium botulinum TaxID=1491 RepID=UPI0009B3CB66|nr:FeoB-associated Cys-rich membrane protein [Clostridium botulinum]NFH79463.1 FeoB-associated Cys-rich membrane protein [Clostridium botulinum]NFH82188.1 FeoB-associated Cys-rich membrane protein [Clostridium botulinum]NFI10162.1 FeoB-associated Cys-rich membrane protein [Clostridium botulinum]NFI15125.1 FeoB-associated Cys-rich membrane protein [Clostridium botulinum]NFO83946.1 FeoB-associated Cys-rich membrane protein [Clostridium botulinum]
MLATIIIAGIIFFLMGLVIVKRIKKAKNGQGGCGCGCTGCSSSLICHGKDSRRITLK